MQRLLATIDAGRADPVVVHKIDRLTRSLADLAPFGREDTAERIRELASGRMPGGTPLGRGHIHHILSNPLYTGRIRHRSAVHDETGVA